jgi:toxin ParE1/3/4
MAAGRRSVVWTQSAQQALDEVLEYIAEDSRDRALSLVQRVLEAAASLVLLAERGRVVPELARPEIRELLVGSYRLLYLVRDGEVVIVGFLDGARDFSTWRREQ